MQHIKTFVVVLLLCKSHVTIGSTTSAQPAAPSKILKLTLEQCNQLRKDRLAYIKEATATFNKVNDKTTMGELFNADQLEKKAVEISNTLNEQETLT